jgi:hypothetical protein
MSFLEPLFLVGLLAAGLPLLVHLFNRKKAIRRQFPAMRFLLESNQKNARSIKVRQWLLMALRILIISLLALALAKPYTFSRAGLTTSDRLPTATVLVLDTSASMLRDGWWTTARDQLDEVLDQIRPWDELGLVITAPQGEGVSVRLSGEHKKVREALNTLQPSYATADIPSALAAAAEQLAASQLPNRRIVLFSDLAQGGWRPEAAPPSPLPYELIAISPRANREDLPKNLGIQGVSYAQEASGQGNTWRFDVTIQNTSDQPIEGREVRLFLDDQIVAADRLAAIEAGRSIVHTFRHNIEGGGLRQARVELVGEDGYKPDDVRYLVLRLRDRLRVLLVNGEPNSIAYRDELFFLSRALNPTRDATSGIVPKLVSPDALLTEQLDGYEVVILANVPRVAPPAAQRLEQYVRAGGGLLLAMGDQVDVEATNNTLRELLPKPLRNIKELALRDDPDAPVKITRIAATLPQHPIFRAFELPGGTTLQSVQVYSYMLLEPGAPQQSKVLLSYKDNAPALVERKVDAGHVLLWTTSVDDEWTDLPVRSPFVPLMQRSVMYLARRAASRAQDSVEVGQRLKLDVSGAVRERVIFQGPLHDNPARVVVEPAEGIAAFTPERPGCYLVWADSDAADDTPQGQRPRNRLDELAFCANTPAAESLLAPLPTNALDPWLSSAQRADQQGAQRGPQRRQNLWPTILFIITLFLLAETILGVRRSVLARITSRLTGRTAAD